ncbi:MAG: capsular polysaccharide biosynthesis protein [Thiolinea sp.]
MHKPDNLLTTSRKLSKHPGLQEFLSANICYVSPGSVPEMMAQAVIAWGRKPSAQKAEVLAEQLSYPLWRLEDGFIHSLGQGVSGAASWSLVSDHQGIYYDATQPSDLENILAGQHEQSVALADPFLLQRAGYLIAQMVRNYVSKYNNASLSTEHLNLPVGKKVLVVDQTAGDMSLQYGMLKDGAAQAMLQAACDEHPDATVLLKTHPDVLAGYKKGCFSDCDLPSQVQVIAEQVNPLVLLEQVEHVYVLTSQLGFEALLLGKKVVCYGVPFYAGWGLTDDRADAALPVFKRRKANRSVDEVFAAAYILYSRYIHPDTGQLCQAEDVINYVAMQHGLFQENAGRLFAFGFSHWKRNYIRRFLHSPEVELNFTNTAARAKTKGFSAHSHLVVWGERALAEAEKLSDEFGVPVWRIEDGFIRSAGLGSDYTPPLSLVLDKRGIYYDPGRSSNLEFLLQTTQFSSDLLQRAESLRQCLVEYAVSKYNVGTNLLQEKVAAKKGQRVVLVPGQVEDDASIRKGCPGISTNSALLHAVRIACPDDYVVYKPHPDVVSGNRKGCVDSAVLEQSCDLVLDDVSITDCLSLADEVHTLTSLVGFEGLLRKKRVVCYGMPFYAGWGLTDDHYKVQRRGRSLELNELVAATLILYPRYINWCTGAFTTPEVALEIIKKQLLAQGGKKKNKIPGLQRLWSKAVHIYHGVFTFRY